MNEHILNQDTLRITEKEKYGIEFLKKAEALVNAIEDAGYNPYNQLVGYLTSGNVKYITRSGGARGLVKELNFSLLWDYTENVVRNK